jgi:hypothetical protein
MRPPSTMSSAKPGSRSAAVIRVGFVPAMHFVTRPSVERGIIPRCACTSALALRFGGSTPCNELLWGSAAVSRRLNGGATPELRADIWQRKNETIGFRVEEPPADWRVASADTHQRRGSYKTRGTAGASAQEFLQLWLPRPVLTNESPIGVSARDAHGTRGTSSRFAICGWCSPQTVSIVRADEQFDGEEAVD